MVAVIIVLELCDHVILPLPIRLIIPLPPKKKIRSSTCSYKLRYPRTSLPPGEYFELYMLS